MVVRPLGQTYILSGTDPKGILALSEDGEPAATWVLPQSLSEAASGRQTATSWD